MLGASGAIGRYALPQLAAEQEPVFAISRAPSQAHSENVQWLQGDLFGAMPALDARIETLFSLGPLDGLAGWLPRSTLPNLRRVIAISSMSAIVKADSSDAVEKALAARLRAAEDATISWCSKAGVEVVVLRPTLIYGAGIDRSLSALATAAKRWHLFPSIPGATGLRQPIHAEDLSTACLAASRLGGSAPRIYAVAGAEALSMGEMLSRVRSELPFPTLPVPVPLAMAKMALAGLRLIPRWRHLRPGLVDRLLVDQSVDISPARRDLGWSPRRFHAGADGGF